MFVIFIEEKRHKYEESSGIFATIENAELQLA